MNVERRLEQTRAGSATQRHKGLQASSLRSTSRPHSALDRVMGNHSKMIKTSSPHIPHHHQTVLTDEGENENENKNTDPNTISNNG
jgi:hypothetical protein